MTIDPLQLARIIKEALNYRIDVAKATVDYVPDENVLYVDIHFYEAGRRKQIQAGIAKLMDGRSCATILNDWLGDEPLDKHGGHRSSGWVREKVRILSNTPQAVLDMARMRMKAAPTATPVASPVEAQASQKAASGEAGGDGKPVVKMTRQQMIQAGMDQAARHEQYRKQGGKHPEDEN